MGNTHRLFEVFRYHNLMTDDDGYHRAALAFIRSLGLDPAKIRRHWVVVRNGGHYELHASEYTYTPAGRHVLDYARNEAVTVPVVVSLGKVADGPCWPEPLNHPPSWPGEMDRYLAPMGPEPLDDPGSAGNALAGA